MHHPQRTKNEYLLIQGFGATQKVATPVTKESLEDAEMDDSLWSEGETKLHHSSPMRIGHISRGRCGWQRVFRELAKGTEQPTERQFMKVKWVGK